ncbi:helix-turn-helix transcriptional regulator [Roseibium sp.]|uniref:helix-turn-helix transcriptional regulator n=1 Tax=Roseibium sp. TaxID=1936156 RepID=UPI003A976B80
MSKLQSAIEAIQNAQSQAEAFGRFCDFIREYGYDRAAFSLISDHPSIGEKAFHGVSTSYPDDWMAHYREQDFHTIDPVFQLILNKPGGFFWSQAIASLRDHQVFDESVLEKSQKMMREAGDAGMADGIGVSIINAWGEVAGIGVSRPHCESDQDVRSLADIYFLAAVLHEKYMSYYETECLPRLTQREKDVLCWSASGKTDWEIAKITGISTATVRFHWNNIFSKMGVNSKISATINAVRRKLIMPESLQPIRKDDQSTQP